MKKNLSYILLLLMSFVLVACGQNATDSKTQSKSNSQKQSFTYAIDSDPSSLNPINTSDRWGLTVTNMMYSPLIRIQPDGAIKYELANKIDTSTDGKTITIHLKKDIKWSDGKPFTADDVVFTYQQKQKKENGNATHLWMNDQPIGISKTDDYTVVFSLPTVSAAALENIVNETYIIPKHSYSQTTDFSGSELKPSGVGTGPYQLVKYQRGEYLQFKANGYYYGGKPKIKTVTLRIIPSADTMKVALQKGEIDASFVLPSVISDLDQKQLTIYPYSENRIGYLGLNTHTEQLKDVKVRQAILYALNKADMNKAAYLDSKYYQTPNSFLPPKNPFHTDKVTSYKTNLSKAKQLLNQAGVSNLKLNLAYASTDPAQTLQATLIQQQLQKIGITVELAGGDGTAIFTELRTKDSTKYNLFLGGYIMGNDPDGYSRLFKSGGASNYFQYSSSATDGLFEKGMVTLDKQQRVTIYNQLQEQIAKDAVIYPIVDNKKILVVNKRIKNVKAAHLIPIYTFEDMSKLSF